MEISKEKYINIVDYSIKSMLELARTDKEYVLAVDLANYYHGKIEKDKVITYEEFFELCKKNGIKPLCEEE